jgi:hypothetical protein
MRQISSSVRKPQFLYVVFDPSLMQRLTGVLKNREIRVVESIILHFIQKQNYNQ